MGTSNIAILSKEYKDKKKIIQEIKAIGKSFQFRVSMDEKTVNELVDIDWFMEVSDEERYFIDFWVIDQNEFNEDRYEVGNENFYISILISHTSVSLSHVNEFLKEFLTKYPDTLVCDEDYKDFYSLEQILSNNVPKWLLA